MSYALVIGYALALAALGWFSARRQGLLGYLIANRNVGATGIGFSVAAGFFDGFVLVSYTGFVYMYGWPAVSLFVGIAVGFVLFYVFAARLRREARDHEYYGMSDFFERRYGHSAAIVVSLMNVVFYLALLLIQFLFGSAILQEISGWPYPVCLVVIAVMLLSYIVLGGFKAVLTTDIFQWALIAVIAAFFFPYFFRTTGGGAGFGHVELRASIGHTIGFLVIGCMGIFSAPELWQRCFAARDDRSIRRGLLLAGLMLPVVGGLLAAIGFAAYAEFPGLAPEDALVKVFREMLPSALEPLGLLLLLSAIMSTADTALFVVAPTVTLNILQVTDDKRKRRLTSLVVVVAVGIAVALGLLVRNVLTVAFALAGLSVGLFPVLIGGLLWRLHPRVVVTSLVLAMVGVGLLVICGEITPETSLVSLPIVLVTLLMGSACAKWVARRRERA